MELQGIGPGAGSEEVRSSKKSNKKSQSAKDTSSGGGSSAEDVVSISSLARTAASTKRELHLVNAVKELPEVRQEKVEQAKEDLKSGKLLSPEVQQKTAEEILKIL